MKIFLDGPNENPYSIDITSYPKSAHSDHVLDLSKTKDEAIMLSARYRAIRSSLIIDWIDIDQLFSCDSRDGVVKLWDTDSLMCGESIQVCTGPVNKLAWFRDKYLTTAQYDRNIKLFKLAPKA